MIQIIGPINPPPAIQKWLNIACPGGSCGGTQQVPGLLLFANALLKLIITLAGLFAFLNIIIAGYQFMSAGGDPKKISEATSKIWQSLMGLLLVAGSFVLAVIFGWLLFGDATAILMPKIYGP
jgi:hypothetical protein